MPTADRAGGAVWSRDREYEVNEHFWHQKQYTPEYPGQCYGYWCPQESVGKVLIVQDKRGDFNYLWYPNLRKDSKNATMVLCCIKQIYNELPINWKKLLPATF